MVSTERRIIAACLKSREAFEKITRLVETDKLNPYSTYLLDLADKYYKRDPNATGIEKDYVVERVGIDFDNPKKGEVYKGFADECFAVDVSALNLAEIIREAKEKKASSNLAQTLVNSYDRNRLLAEVDDFKELLVDGISLEGRDTIEVFNNVSVEEINAKVLDPQSRIKLLSNRMVDALNGGVIRGHCIWLFARPETGKSALAITISATLAKQGLKVAYFENEDPIRATIERAQGCCSRMPSVDRLRDPKAAQAVLDAQGYKNIDFVQLTPGRVEEIDQYCVDHKPDAIMVNQFRNLLTKAENRTNQLESICLGLRRMAQRRDIVVFGVTQCGDSGTDKLVLEMGDIDGSNTGVPGQGDVIIGVGMNKEYEKDHLRMISLCKNKTGGGHQFFKMKIDEKISRYEDV